MQPKKYTAKSIQAAINKVKGDLGSDAMILSTKRVPALNNNSGKNDLFEVTALPNSTTKISSPFANYFQQQSVQKRDRIDIRIDEDLDDEFDNITKSFLNKNKEKTSSFNNFNKESSDELKSIKDELFSIKELLFLLNHEEVLPGFFIDYPEALKLYARLVKTGISKKRVQAFIHNAYKNLDAINVNRALLNEDDITKQVLNEILSSIEVLNPFSSKYYNSHNTKRCLAAFIGPTGVGKTTTIAKLAAELSLKQKKSVGLISIDSYRIGALEQLKTYSAIIGLPCIPAFTQRDLQIAVNKLRDKEIILIDTAGHSHLDQKRMQEIASVIEGDLAISTHLVLSATTGSINMNEAAKNFSFLNPETYVFTKVDETRIRGCIIEQINHVQMPISYITNGQKVPEDLILATKKNVLKMILKQE